MKSRNLIYLCLILCAFIDNINAKEKELDNSLQAQSMLSVLYAQSSAEYEASNIQTYLNQWSRCFSHTRKKVQQQQIGLGLNEIYSASLSTRRDSYTLMASSG